MKENQAIYPVSAMCRLLKVSTAGFYHWWDRPMSERERRDVELTALVQQIHESSFGALTEPRGSTWSCASSTRYMWDASGWPG